MTHDKEGAEENVRDSTPRQIPPSFVIFFSSVVGGISLYAATPRAVPAFRWTERGLAFSAHAALRRERLSTASIQSCCAQNLPRPRA